MHVQLFFVAYPQAHLVRKIFKKIEKVFRMIFGSLFYRPHFKDGKEGVKPPTQLDVLRPLQLPNAASISTSQRGPNSGT